MAFKIWVSINDQFVDINVCFPSFADCYSSYTATAKSYLSGTSTPVNVNTNVTVDAYWYGDLSGYIYFPLVIASGTNCDSALEPATYVDCGGEYYSYDGVSVSPFDFGYQFYSVGPTSTGLCSC
jgi:hypothetical protein